MIRDLGNDMLDQCVRAVEVMRLGLTRCAWTEDGVVQGVRTADGRAVGVQFHPESVLTPHGPALLAAFLDLGGVA